jgi:hypothetical protein
MVRFPQVRQVYKLSKSKANLTFLRPITVASWLQIPRLRREQVLCDENIQFMKQSVNKCTSECCHPKTTDFIPTRLLYLESGPYSDYVRLIVASETIGHLSIDIKSFDYAALSYCWGSPNDGQSQLCTKKDSLEARKGGIKESSMPPVLRDAIQVCRSLSIQYLWIDCLCIIQDDITDWERECALMSHVYSHALVTICTLSSTSCREGFLRRNRRHISIPFASHLSPSIVGQYSLVASGTCRDRVLFGWPALDEFHSAWASRGWTLQESLTSSRKLLFVEFMINFQCDSIVASETGYCKTGIPTSMFRVERSIMNQHPLNFGEWDNQVLQDYGERNYTNIQDKLPGISGMAKSASDGSGDTYLAGLWKRDLPYALMWFPYSHSAAEYNIELQELVDKLCCPSPYIAPSWSPIRLMGVRFERGLRFSRPALFRDTTSAESIVIEAQTTPAGQDPFGMIQDGLIRIRGRLATVTSDIILLPCYRFLPGLWYFEDKGDIIAYCNLDCFPKSNAYPRRELRMLMLVSTEGSESWRTILHQEHRESNSECSCGYSYPEDTLSDDSASDDPTPGKHLAPRSPSTRKYDCEYNSSLPF